MTSYERQYQSWCASNGYQYRPAAEGQVRTEEADSGSLTPAQATYELQLQRWCEANGQRYSPPSHGRVTEEFREAARRVEAETALAAERERARILARRSSPSTPAPRPAPVSVGRATESAAGLSTERVCDGGGRVL